MQCDSEVLRCHGGADVDELIILFVDGRRHFIDKVRTLSSTVLSFGFHGAV